MDFLSVKEFFTKVSNWIAKPTAPSMTESELTDFLDSLNRDYRGSVDWIIEQGTSGIWIYRKWYSGIAECWGRYTVSNVDVSDSWSSKKNAFFSSLGGISYPFTFIDIPVSQITDSSPSGQGWLIRNSDNESASQTGTIYVVSPMQYTGNNVINKIVINIYVIGRWQ